MSAICAGSVKTKWKYGTGSNSASRSASHSCAAAPWHFGQCRLRTPVAAAVVGDDREGAVFTARHVAAERGRAAALDRTHHLHLVEADVSGIGATPRRSVVAEDIRDLQRWTGHGRRYAGSRSLLLFLGFLRGCDSRSSGLSMPAIRPVAMRV